MKIKFLSAVLIFMIACNEQDSPTKKSTDAIGSSSTGTSSTRTSQSGARVAADCSEQYPCSKGWTCVNGGCRENCGNYPPCPKGYFCGINENGIRVCKIIIDGPDGPGTCKAKLNNIWCSQASPGYNAQINVDVFVTNPFSNPASVLIQWDPNYYSGFQVAGGQYNLGVGGVGNSVLLPSQFDILVGTGWPNSFNVRLIVQYTDLYTNKVCTVHLNPLVTGGCNRAPM